MKSRKIDDILLLTKNERGYKIRSAECDIACKGVTLMVDELSFPTKIVSNQNAISYLQKISNERILIVTDQFIEKMTIFNKLLETMRKKNDFQIFSDVIPDPPIEIISSGVSKLKNMNGTMLLAIGGGSVIDAAKGIKFIARQLEYNHNLELIVIPTTSGSGSEVTNFSIITDEITNTKHPIVLDFLQPDVAILDVEFVKSMPPMVTADTGMDVLTHILEAYVSTNSTVFSDALCEKAIVLLFEFLPLAFRDGNNQLARENVHLCSTMAGMAFNTTSLGINHSLSHAAGAKLHIPHGRLNTILMPEVIKYNSGLACSEGSINEVALEKYAYLASLLDLPNFSYQIAVKKLLEAIDKLRISLAMPKTLGEAGITKKDLQEHESSIIYDAMSDPCTLTNPINPSEDSLKKILWAVY